MSNPAASATFTNELGNRIRVCVKSARSSAVEYKTGKSVKFTGVGIAITGPTSMSENIVTRREAEELFYMLKKFLHK